MMTARDKTYRAICFDLDGTLLGMDIDEFMSAYFARIAAWAAGHGLDPERFLRALKSGTRAMALSNDGSLNKDVFWPEFYDDYGLEDLEGIDVEGIADSFYEEDFRHIGDGFEPDPLIVQTIETLRGKGYPLLLTTMPMFPMRAVEHRLAWVGIDPSSFERITTYENSKTTKPRQTYFAENLAAMGVDGRDVLMVGNNTMEDMAFLDLGADGYLVTDWLLDPIGMDISKMRSGSFEEFSQWAASLPDCEHPAVGIEKGPIDDACMARAYRDNIRSGFDEGSASQNSKLLADAIEHDEPLGSMRSQDR